MSAFVRRSKFMLAPLALLLVAGCTLREQPEIGLAPVPHAWTYGPTARPGTVNLSLVDWWKQYRDPQVSLLVNQALAGNPSVAEALYRVQAARALARADNALRFPQGTPRAGIEITSRLAGPAAGLNEAGEAAGQGERRTVGVGQAGVDASWEIDLFGRLGAQAGASERNAEARVEDLEAARTTLAADVVRTYIELRGAQRRRAVVVNEIEARRQLAQLVRSQQAAGLAGEFDVQRAAATFEAARARLPLVEAEVALATQRLATLTGQPAATAALRRSMGGIPMTATPGPTLPADLLRMRPDIRRSELTVLQRAALAEVAYAELFPRLTLGGSIEVRANVLATPIAGTPVTVAGGPGISIPLFDWGQRRALLNAREAELKEGIASYRRVVLEAVGEVEIALSQVRQQALRVDRLRTAVDAARRAFVTAQRLYQAGEINLTERLQAEADLRQAELDFAAASETRAVALVTLYRALGAGPGRLPALPAPTAAPPPLISILARESQ
ncbi:efflux transporter outer membrane subunit [Phreatobacter sp.]|jgi:multidrug efflux system outer membrane protein|uniref:efflux transporter outer membrane subunit n=2 Tax=Phreatobacteraceae TaxID=2843305 RepID=UPI0025E7DB04|nr:efflux transporter outer membrane subunit [Phreatobacter sp.]